MDVSMVVVKSCFPNSYSFSNIFTDFSASDIRNFSKIVFLELFHSAETFTQVGLFGAPLVLLIMIDEGTLPSRTAFSLAVRGVSNSTESHIL